MIKTKHNWIWSLLLFGAALALAACVQPSLALATSETPTELQGDYYAEGYEALRNQDIEYSEASEGSGSTAYYLIYLDSDKTKVRIIPEQNVDEPAAITEIPKALPQTGDNLWIPIVCLSIAALCACTALILSKRSTPIEVPKGPTKRKSVQKSK